MDGLLSPKRIKREPTDDAPPAAPPLPTASRPKPSASPAQEATRGRIASFEAQLKRLYRLRNNGKLEASQGAFQIRCLEEDLRKAHSKLRRLLNEAERQRRRRERLKSGASVATHRSDAGGGDPQRPPTPAPSPDDRSIMAALQSCDRFEDFARELHSLGFSLSRMNSAPQELYDDLDSDCGDIDGVKVQVELIEGEAPLLSPHPQHPGTESDESSDDEFPGHDQINNHDRISNHDPINIHDQINNHNDDGAEDGWDVRWQRWWGRQREWEEGMMREQMQLARSSLEAVTTTFLAGIQQILQNVTAPRRFPPPFCPHPPFHQPPPSRVSTRRKK